MHDFKLFYQTWWLSRDKYLKSGTTKIKINTAVISSISKGTNVFFFNIEILFVVKLLCIFLKHLFFVLHLKKPTKNHIRHIECIECSIKKP